MADHVFGAMEEDEDDGARTRAWAVGGEGKWRVGISMKEMVREVEMACWVSSSPLCCRGKEEEEGC